jgi:hypothetical protein
MVPELAQYMSCLSCDQSPETVAHKQEGKNWESEASYPMFRWTVVTIRGTCSSIIEKFPILAMSINVNIIGDT